MTWVVNVMTRPLYPRGKHGTHCIDSWVGPWAEPEEWENSQTPSLPAHFHSVQTIPATLIMYITLKRKGIKNRNTWQTAVNTFWRYVTELAWRNEMTTRKTAYGRITIGYLLNASRTYAIHNTYGAPGLRRDKKTWTIFRIPVRKRMLHTSFHIVWWWARM